MGQIEIHGRVRLKYTHGSDSYICPGQIEVYLWVKLIKLRRRLDAAKKDVGDTGGGQYLNDYIKQLKQDINNLEKEKSSLQGTNSNNLYEQDLLKQIRDNLKFFALNIKILQTDQQYLLLKTYIKQVMKDSINNGFKLDYVIPNPLSPEAIIFEKTLYIE